MTDTINGYPVVASHRAPITGPGRVVLVERANHPVHPFVTAWQGEGDEGWHWGHYFATYAEAESDFDHRCARGY